MKNALHACSHYFNAFCYLMEHFKLKIHGNLIVFFPTPSQYESVWGTPPSPRQGLRPCTPPLRDRCCQYPFIAEAACYVLLIHMFEEGQDILAGG